METSRLEIGALKEGTGTICNVQDTGAGFCMTEAGQIFKPFQRLHRSDQYEGYGIGFAVVKRIIDRHCGKIWVETTQGEGSTFFFTLPTA